MTAVTAPKATTRDDAPKRRTPPRWNEVREDIPDPGSTAGAYFHYTPAEAALWLPFEKDKIRRMMFAREIPHVNNGARLWLSGMNIRAISEQFTVQPFAKNVAA
ncbi:hypothetical protein [Streptomyces sp. B21-101]|uniref:hypothetical protein n=1 Tax=Streptomyces sp. B21-101 TaxID=3039415 RepID=UPI002FEF0F22